MNLKDLLNELVKRDIDLKQEGRLEIVVKGGRVIFHYEDDHSVHERTVEAKKSLTPWSKPHRDCSTCSVREREEICSSCDPATLSNWCQ